MAGIAAAFGGFAKGYGEGAKLRSDLEDAEERRGLMRLQKEAAQLDLEKRRDEREYEKERKTLLEGIFNAKPAAEVAAPPADQESLPEYERSQPGIRVPGQGMFAGANGASVNDLGTLSKLQNAMTYLDAKHGKIGVKEMLEGAKRYKELQNEGVMDAWQKVAAGDYDGAINTFNSTGKFKLPEGTRFESRQEDDGFGAGRKITNYYAIAPDGREVNYRDMMRNTIAPEKLMELDSATGYRIADLGLKRTAEENAAQRHTEIFKLTEKKYDRLIEEQKAQTGIALRRLGLAESDAKYQRTQQAFTGAFTELANSVGVDKRFDSNLASPEDKKEQAGKLQAASMASSIFEMNYDLNKNAAGLTPQASLDMLKYARANPSSVKFDDDKGMHYVERGKSKVYIPSVLAPKSEAASAPATAPAGIKPPSGPSVPGRPLYNANQSDLLRIATKPRGISSAEAAEAQAEIDARKGESRMSGR